MESALITRWMLTPIVSLINMLRRRGCATARKDRPEDVAASAALTSAMRKYPWIIVVVFLLLTAVFFGSTAALGLLADFGSKAPELKIQFLPPLLLLFSAPIMLATAVATLMLAHAATRIADQQSRRELYVRVQEKADNVVSLYTTLAVAMAGLIRSSGSILHLAPELDSIQQGREPSQTLMSRIGGFGASLDELDFAIQEVQNYPVAGRLLKVDLSKSKMVWMTEKLKGISSWGADYSPDDWTSFRQFIRSCQNDLRSYPTETVGAAYRAILLAGKGKGGADGRFRPLEWTAFAGYLIQVFEGPLERGDRCVFSLGLAMLHDMFLGLPDAERIAAHLNHSFSAGDSGVEVDFDRDAVLGTIFRDGMEESRRGTCMRRLGSEPYFRLEADAPPAEGEVLDARGIAIAGDGW